MAKTEVRLPPKLKFLLEEHWRYKVAYGGRGSAKSWSFATALLVRGAERPCRFLCCREIQKSLKDSVHQLLRDRIQELNLESFYEVTNTGITGKNGTQFGFEGLRHNITNIKSWEGADVAWVEEAHVVSKNSWEILIPTIRKEDSEIWVTFNPELEEDETYQRFVVNVPPDCKTVKMNWSDNEWFPQVLRSEMDYLKQRDYAAYENIWEGKCRSAIAGAVYASELRLCAEEGRIRTVPYDKSKPVDVFFDLGRSDLTSIWFAQLIGFEYRILRYFSDSGKHFSHFIKYMKELPYAYGTIYLPHDAKHEQLAAEKSIASQAREAFSSIVVLPVSPVATGIEAARAIFPKCFFDKDLCSDGLSALRRYAYKVNDETGKVSREPDHNIYSHGADAFRYLALAMKPQAVIPVRKHNQNAPWWVK